MAQDRTEHEVMTATDFNSIQYDNLYSAYKTVSSEVLLKVKQISLGVVV